MILCTLKGISGNAFQKCIKLYFFQKKMIKKEMCSYPTNGGLTLYTGWFVGPNLGPNCLQWLSEGPLAVKDESLFFLSQRKKMPAQTSARGEESPMFLQRPSTGKSQVTYFGEDISRNIYKRSRWYRYDEKPGCIQKWR